MQRTEMRPTVVNYCDGCNAESNHLEKCVVCKRHFCMADGGKKHFVYSIEVYRYSDANRIPNGHVCAECAAGTPNVLSLQQLLDGMLGKTPIEIIHSPTAVIALGGSKVAGPLPPTQ